MATEQYSGPIDFMVFTLPKGADPGPGLLALITSVMQGRLELLDIEFVVRDADGNPSRVPHAEVLSASSIETSLFDGAFSGILDEDDLATIATELEPGQLAIALVYEDRSLAAPAKAWTVAGGSELFSGGIDVADLDHTLDEGNPA